MPAKYPDIILAHGDDPSQFDFDPAKGKDVWVGPQQSPVAAAPRPATPDVSLIDPGEMLRSGERGFGGAITTPMKGALRVNEYLGIPTGFERGVIGSAENLMNKYLPLNPGYEQAGGIRKFINRTLPGAVGAALPYTAAAIASGGLSIPGNALAAGMGTVGGITAGEAAAEQEHNRRAQLGLPESPTSELTKGAIVGAPVGVIQGLAGMGPLGQLMAGPSGAPLKSVLLRQGVGGTLAGGASAAIREGVVNEEVPSLTDAAVEGVAQGITQAGFAGGHAALAPKAPPVLPEVKAEVAPSTAGPASMRKGAAQATRPAEEIKIPDNHRQAMLIAAEKGEKYTPPYDNEVIKAWNKLVDKEVPVAEKDLNDLEAAHAADPRGVNKGLEKLVNDKYADAVVAKPITPPTAAESIQSAVDVTKERAADFGQLEKLKKNLGDFEEQIAAAPDAASRWQLQSKHDFDLGEYKKLEASIIAKWTRGQPEPSAAQVLGVVPDPSRQVGEGLPLEAPGLLGETEFPIPSMPLGGEGPPLATRSIPPIRIGEPLGPTMRLGPQLPVFGPELPPHGLVIGEPFDKTGMYSGEQPFTSKYPPRHPKEFVPVPRLPAEGEQRGPFGPVSEQKVAPEIQPSIESATKSAKVEELPPESPAEGTLYGPFGVDPTMLWKAWKGLGKLFPKGFDRRSIPQLFTKAVVDKMATQGPSGGHMAAKDMEVGRTSREIENYFVKEARTAGLDKAMRDPRFVKWMNEGLSNQTDDISTLPPELQAQGAAYRAYKQEQHQFQIDQDVGVSAFDPATGRHVVRPPQNLPGYASFPIAQHVYDAAHAQGAEWTKLRQDFFDNWQQYKGNLDGAEAALNDTIKTQPESVTQGGTPEFSAVRVEHGVPLPESWRGNNVWEGELNYIHKYANDIAFAKVFQHDPVGRRVLGLKEDPMGRETDSSDPVTWDQAPEQWRAAVRQGRESGAVWANNADPDSPPAEPILEIKGKENMVPWMANFRGQALGVTGAGRQRAQAANALAGSLIMQTGTGARDVIGSVPQTLTYIPVAHWAEAVSKIAAELASPREAIAKAQAAGAMPHNVAALDYANTHDLIVGSLRRASDQIRKFTGRDIGDKVGKAVTFNVVHDLALAGKLDKLVADLVDPSTALTPEDQANQVAMKVTNIIHNPPSAANLPAGLLPQAPGLVTHLLQLSKWAIGSSNNYYKHVIRPAFNGDIAPLVKSALIGQVSGVAAQTLIEFITKRKPRHLTWGEWLSLPTEQKFKEFFPVWLGYSLPVAGLGTMLANTAVQTYLGRTKVSSPNLSIQSPLPIVLADWTMKVMSFANAADAGYMKWSDIHELGGELAKTAQIVRMLSGRDDNRPATREKRIFTEVYGLNPKDMERVPHAAGLEQIPLSDPFAFSRRLRDAKTPEEFKKLMPYIRSRGENPPVLTSRSMHPLFYKELERRQGTAASDAQKAADQAADRDAMIKNLLVREISKAGPIAEPE